MIALMAKDLVMRELRSRRIDCSVLKLIVNIGF